jgi:hypothetical protein
MADDRSRRPRAVARRPVRPAPEAGPQVEPVPGWVARAPEGPQAEAVPVVVAASAAAPVVVAASAAAPVVAHLRPDCGVGRADAVVPPSVVPAVAVGTSRSSSRRS